MSLHVCGCTRAAPLSVCLSVSLLPSCRLRRAEGERRAKPFFEKEVEKTLRRKRNREWMCQRAEVDSASRREETEEEREKKDANEEEEELESVSFLGLSPLDRPLQDLSGASIRTFLGEFESGAARRPCLTAGPRRLPRPLVLSADSHSPV